MHARAIFRKPRYFEKFKINISTGRIQTKFSTRKRLNTTSVLYYTHIDYLWRIPKSSRDIQDFLDMKYSMFAWPNGE
jgi:hypothetical protein